MAIKIIGLIIAACAALLFICEKCPPAMPEGIF